jgi:CRISPR-associated protein Csb2
MPLILEQQFPLGRFHATRWNQNPFEDRFGEWPPSPWRLLRALAARWIQYSCESGDEEVTARDELLRVMGSQVPSFCLPELTWRTEPAIRQYHKTGVEWTAKGKKDPAYKKSMTTLVPDHCRAIPPKEPIYWCWPSLELPVRLLNLLDQLLRRVLYFGRAESFCRMRRVQTLPTGVEPNCRLSPSAKDHPPVLVPSPGMSLHLESLLASTDDAVLKGRSIPPGAVWHYAKLPTRPPVSSPRPSVHGFPNELQMIQFAVGGRVYPPLSQWIRVTERFRGILLKEIAGRSTGNHLANFDRLPATERDRFALMSGKMSSGIPLIGHQHAYFALYPDEFGLPTRLIVFRRTPFESEEIEALMAASEKTLSWQPQGQDWQLRFVPLPFSVPPPFGLAFDSQRTSKWKSLTPFVSPGGRLHFRKNGRMRPGETPERLLENLLLRNGYPRPRIQRITAAEGAEWVAVHESKEQRAIRRKAGTRAVLPGYRFEIQFPEPVSGPICVGHSCHFGLGLFIPGNEKEVAMP